MKNYDCDKTAAFIKTKKKTSNFILSLFQSLAAHHCKKKNENSPNLAQLTRIYKQTVQGDVRFEVRLLMLNFYRLSTV